MDFAISTDYRVKMKEGENIDKYFNVAREKKKPAERIPKAWKKRLEELELRGRIKTTALLRLARIIRRVLEIWC